MIHVDQLDRVPVLYFVRVVPDGPIQLGVSESFRKRLELLRAYNHEALEPLGVICYKTVEEAREEEARLREHFASAQIHRRWFRAEALLDYVLRTAELVSEEEPEDVPESSSFVEAPITVDELAAFFDVTSQVVRRAIRKRRIPHIRVGRRFLFLISEVEQWIRRSSAAVAGGFPVRSEAERPPLAREATEAPITKRQREREALRLADVDSYGLPHD